MENEAPLEMLLVWDIFVWFVKYSTIKSSINLQVTFNFHKFLPNY